MAGRKRRSLREISKRREAASTRGGGGRPPLTRQKPSIDESRIAHRLHHSPSSSAVAAAVVRVPPPPAPEDRIALNHHEIQSLLVDNQRLASTHVALKQDLTATQQELRLLASSVANVKAERDIEVRQIYEQSLKMDAQVRAIEAMSSDLVRVRADIQELDEARKDLASQLQLIESEIAMVRASDHVPAIKSDIEAMRREIQRGRKAIEYEKKTYASNLEHRETMDKNMIIMAREVEKLRLELSNAEKRARAAVAVAEVANPSHPANYDNPEMVYGGIADSYIMHQIQSVADAHPQYPSGAALQHPFDMQHTHVHR
ncbi:protein FLX-like 1 [Senna tora]|uniref:Protein FLX-like 1 n=1 Tax=Senna tora TaxID=362788 RepID=A0A834WW83_9FABA|nr:protein FLX-like 1 [Senna tora]